MGSMRPTVLDAKKMHNKMKKESQAQASHMAAEVSEALIASLKKNGMMKESAELENAEAPEAPATPAVEPIVEEKPAAPKPAAPAPAPAPAPVVPKVDAGALKMIKQLEKAGLTAEADKLKKQVG